MYQERAERNVVRIDASQSAVPPGRDSPRNVISTNVDSGGAQQAAPAAEDTALIGEGHIPRPDCAVNLPPGIIQGAEAGPLDCEDHRDSPSQMQSPVAAKKPMLSDVSETYKEMKATHELKEMLTRLDRNKDGEIDTFELYATVKEFVEKEARHNLVQRLLKQMVAVVVVLLVIAMGLNALFVFLVVDANKDTAVLRGHFVDRLTGQEITMDPASFRVRARPVPVERATHHLKTTTSKFRTLDSASGPSGTISALVDDNGQTVVVAPSVTGSGTFVSADGTPVKTGALKYHQSAAEVGGLGILWDLDTETLNSVDSITTHDGSTEVRFGLGPFQFEEKWSVGEWELASDQRVLAEGLNYTGAVFLLKFATDHFQYPMMVLLRIVEFGGTEEQAIVSTYNRIFLAQQAVLPKYTLSTAAAAGTSAAVGRRRLQGCGTSIGCWINKVDDLKDDIKDLVDDIDDYVDDIDDLTKDLSKAASTIDSYAKLATEQAEGLVGAITDVTDLLGELGSLVDKIIDKVLKFDWLPKNGADCADAVETVVNQVLNLLPACVDWAGCSMPDQLKGITPIFQSAGIVTVTATITPATCLSVYDFRLNAAALGKLVTDATNAVQDFLDPAIDDLRKELQKLIGPLSSKAEKAAEELDDALVGSCSDGIQNQRETGVDCGGPCIPCGTVIKGNSPTSWGSWGSMDTCRGWAIGVNIKIQGIQGSSDDTAANAVELLCDDYQSKRDSKVGSRGSWQTLETCPYGTLITGFRLRVEPNQGSGDDTAANAIEVRCSDGTTLRPHDGHWGDWTSWSTCPDGYAVAGLQTRVEEGANDDSALNDVNMLCREVVAELPLLGQSPTSWGKWGPMETCDGWATGINIKFQAPQGSGDDSAGNAVEIVCDDGAKHRSAEGPSGSWRTQQACPGGAFINAFRIRVEEPRPEGGDDSALNAIEAKCSDGTVLSPHSGEWGAWTPWRACSEGYGVAGLQTLVQASQGSEDDTALNDVNFLCRKGLGETSSYALGPLGEDKCPHQLSSSLSTPQACAQAAYKAGLAYDASANDGSADAVCHVCGGCEPPIVRLSSGHGSSAKWLCQKTEYVLGANGDDNCPVVSLPYGEVRFKPITDPSLCAAAAATLVLAYQATYNDGHADAVCNYCGGCGSPAARLSNNHGANAKWICQYDRFVADVPDMPGYGLHGPFRRRGLLDTEPAPRRNAPRAHATEPAPHPKVRHMHALAHEAVRQAHEDGLRRLMRRMEAQDASQIREYIVIDSLKVKFAQGLDARFVFDFAKMYGDGGDLMDFFNAPPGLEKEQMIQTPIPGLMVKVMFSGRLRLPYHFLASGGVTFTVDVKLSDLWVEADVAALEIKQSKGDWTGTGLQVTQGVVHVGGALAVELDLELRVGVCLFALCVDFKTEADMHAKVGFDVLAAQAAQAPATYAPLLTTQVQYDAAAQATYADCVAAAGDNGPLLAGGAWAYVTKPYVRVTPVLSFDGQDYCPSQSPKILEFAKPTTGRLYPVLFSHAWLGFCLATDAGTAWHVGAAQGALHAGAPHAPARRLLSTDPGSPSPTSGAAPPRRRCLRSGQLVKPSMAPRLCCAAQAQKVGRFTKCK